MAYLATFHWGWLAGSLALGFAMGWIAVVQHGTGLSRSVARSLAAVTVILVVLSIARVVPGRPGYWLDLFLVMFAFYLVGCVIGSWLRGLVVARHAMNRIPDA